jgi:hypothetical protein
MAARKWEEDPLSPGAPLRGGAGGEQVLAVAVV